MTKEEQLIAELIKPLDITINGNRAWDPQIHNPAFYKRVFRETNLGLGESYMEGWWDCEALDQFFYKLLEGNLTKILKGDFRFAAYFLKSRIFNLQKKSTAAKLKHYDTGNDLFAKMLDQRMVYTCGYWKHAVNLEQAQEAKLDLVCRKLGLKPGMKILDIGCGWGSFMKYAAEKYGVSCVGITISPSQKELGEKLCQGLPVEFILQDYRDLTGQYDAIVSLGMLEHVGAKNYQAYMEIAQRCLTDTGLFLLHTIGGHGGTDPWVHKYIFPHGVIPSKTQITGAIGDLFVLEDWHNFGTDYDKTLMAWWENFEKGWPELKNNYDEAFHRMWRYYLASCAAAFRARKLYLWQIVLSKHGMQGGYHSIR